MTMKTSPSGVAALRQREGCRLRAYLDSVGVPTIGVGHTGRAGPPAVQMGMTITQAEADAILAADLVPFETAVNGVIKGSVNQNEFDAMVSLAFNIGETAFKGSSVVRRLNAGDRQGAADAFLMWVKPPELRGRRVAERAQFLGSAALTAHNRSATVGSRPISKSKVAAAGAAVGTGAAAATVIGHPELQGMVWGLGIAAVIALAVFLFLHFRKK